MMKSKEKKNVKKQNNWIALGGLIVVAILLIVVFGTPKDESAQENKQLVETGEIAIPDDSQLPAEVKVTEDGTRYYKVHPSEILSGGPPKDGIPSIDNPKVISIAEADAEGKLKDDDLILGLFFNGEARAYPHSILNWHEIVNDEVKGKKVLITYCPLCQTGIAFDPNIQGKAVEFGTSGKLWNSNLVMYDRATDTYWSQITGEAIVGPLSGSRLDKIPLDTATWEDWKKKYPTTKVLSFDTGYFRDYDIDPYGDYKTSDFVGFGTTFSDTRLQPKAIVYGLEINGKHKAYSEEAVRNKGGFVDNFADIEIEVDWDAELKAVRFADKKTNEPIIPVYSFWFSWAAAHPETELFTA